MANVKRNIEKLSEMLDPCRLCPRNCRVHRRQGRAGYCRIGAQADVASYGAHFGEEPVLVGPGGSGTIFLAGCNLHCVFCQNCSISESPAGRPVSAAVLAELCLDLEEGGCANVNFVTPTHVTHAVAEAIHLARQRGLRVPVVYNCGGYERLETLRLLEGLVEIYMPDFKTAGAEAGRAYLNAPDYPEVAAASLAEMFRQVGTLEVAPTGLATRGVLVRHLVLPEDAAGSEACVRKVAEVAPRCAINVMGQYRPAHRAPKLPALAGRPDPADVASLRRLAADLGLRRVN